MTQIQHSIQKWPRELIYMLVDQMMKRTSLPGILHNYANLALLHPFAATMYIPLYVMNKTTCQVDYNREESELLKMCVKLSYFWLDFKVARNVFNDTEDYGWVIEFIEEHRGQLYKYNCARGIKNMLDRSNEYLRERLVRSIWDALLLYRALGVLCFMLMYHPPPDKLCACFSMVDEWANDSRNFGALGRFLNNLPADIQELIVRVVFTKKEFYRHIDHFIQDIKDYDHVDLMQKLLANQKADVVDSYLRHQGPVNNWEPLIRRMSLERPPFTGYRIGLYALLTHITNASNYNKDLPAYEHAKDPVGVLMDSQDRLLAGATYDLMLAVALDIYDSHLWGTRPFVMTGVVRLGKELLDKIKDTAIRQECRLCDARFAKMFNVDRKRWEESIDMFHRMQARIQILDDKYEWLLLYNPQKRCRISDGSDTKDESRLRRHDSV